MNKSYEEVLEFELENAQNMTHQVYAELQKALTEKMELWKIASEMVEEKCNECKQRRKHSTRACKDCKYGIAKERYHL